MRLIISKKASRKHIAGYLFTGLACMLYALFVDIRFGLTFLIVLAAAPLLSSFITSLAIKGLSVNGHISNTILNKGNSLTLTVAVKNGSIIPIPFLRLELIETFNLETNGKNKLVFTLAPNSDKNITKSYTAVISGVSEIGVKSLEASDFLGLCTYLIRLDNSPVIYAEYAEILPNIPEIRESLFLREAMDDCIIDDNEETLEHAVSLSGMPGFEHRRYIPGDPLKKINWKLSSKYDQYMVRLDEPVANPKQTVIIDCLGIQNAGRDKQIFLEEERLAETVLALLRIMTKQHLQCNVYYFMNNKWQGFFVENEDDLVTLQYTLAGYKFIRNPFEVPGRLPKETLNNAGTVMLFTSMLDRHILNLVSGLKQMQTHVKIVVPRAPQLHSDDTWLVNDLFEITRLL